MNSNSVVNVNVTTAIAILHVHQDFATSTAQVLGCRAVVPQFSALSCVSLPRRRDSRGSKRWMIWTLGKMHVVRNIVYLE